MFCIFSSSFFHVRHIRFPQAPGAPPLLPPGALPLGPPATLTLQLSHPLEPAPKQKDKKEKEAIKKTHIRTEIVLKTKQMGIILIFFFFFFLNKLLLC